MDMRKHQGMQIINKCRNICACRFKPQMRPIIKNLALRELLAHKITAFFRAFGCQNGSHLARLRHTGTNILIIHMQIHRKPMIKNKIHIAMMAWSASAACYDMTIELASALKYLMLESAKGRLTIALKKQRNRSMVFFLEELIRIYKVIS